MNGIFIALFAYGNATRGIANPGFLLNQNCNGTYKFSLLFITGITDSVFGLGFGLESIRIMIRIRNTIRIRMRIM